MTSPFLVQLETDYTDSMQMPKFLLRNYRKIGIKPNEWSLYCLISYLESEGEEIPTQPELGKMMGLSERQVKAVIAQLKNKKLLNIDRKSPSKYDFKPLIKKAMEFDQAN